ncbi:MAG: glutathione peroxidase [Acidimicrobiales bacterium]|jgi:glutathione peroxidase|nr:glutathione peroxidase [Acidimicrobiales bacterium]
MNTYDVDIAALDGTPDSLRQYQGTVSLMVNVASKCGLTPQYEGLVRLQQQFHDRGFNVLGFPCNQFLGQEPGSPEEIAAFCSTTYGVDFPLFEKIDVNGDDRHALYASLTETADAEGHSGDIRWNFEKFLVGSDGSVIARYAPMVDPEADEIVAAIEAALPG